MAGGGGLTIGSFVFAYAGDPAGDVPDGCGYAAQASGVATGNSDGINVTINLFDNGTQIDSQSGSFSTPTASFAFQYVPSAALLNSIGSNDPLIFTCTVTDQGSGETYKSVTGQTVYLSNLRHAVAS